MRGQIGSRHLVNIVHSCGHEGTAQTNARNPNTAVDVIRQRTRPCYDCTVKHCETCGAEMLLQASQAKYRICQECADKIPDPMGDTRNLIA